MEGLILKWIIKEKGCGLDWAGSGQNELTASCKCTNENMVSIKCG
jgi:hypothetical protein